MKRHHLVFNFKGTRTYIQGPDMVNSVLETASGPGSEGAVRDLKFSINRMISSNADLEYGENLPDDGQLPAASISWSSGSKQIRGRLLQTADVPTCRQNYDESLVQSACRTDRASKTIVIGADSPFTPIETYVSMTKALHQQVMPDAAGKWVFCRLESPTWPPQGPMAGTCVSLVQAVGTRLTKNRVEKHGKLVCWIYFSSKVNP
jgi:hypothetical protein